ncbi:MAG: mandelate racemase/muconate lactonizing enzyme family protein [Alphaproteobacteria bacterium]|nr:MAG: mandelate racemase/muconate lactonizing enzyme family protein [Alphaproteobacteria bacterium]
MKIAAITPHLLRHRLEAEEQFQSSFSTFTDRWACLVEITCEDGTIGWGECLGPSRTIAAAVEEIAPLLIGRDPRDVERLWTEVYAAIRDQGRSGPQFSALSGIDIALWDICGKAYGQPVHRLLGGAWRREVLAYATGGFRPVRGQHHARVLEEVAGYVRQGFSAVKIKIGYDAREDAGLIREVRARIGPGVRLMIDANHGYDAVEAAWLGREVADCDIHWFEEPVVPEALGAYAELKRAQPLALAAGETWAGRHEFARPIAERVVEILQPDLCGCGGFTEFRKIVAMAETAGLRVVPHVWGSGVAVAAALHAIAALPPIPKRHAAAPVMLEFDRTPNPWRMDVLARPIEHEGGIVPVPEGAGLGIEVNRAKVLAWAPDP